MLTKGEEVTSLHWPSARITTGLMKLLQLDINLDLVMSMVEAMKRNLFTSVDYVTHESCDAIFTDMHVTPALWQIRPQFDICQVATLSSPSLPTLQFLKYFETKYDWSVSDCV